MNPTIDIITVSERVTILIPSLTQAGLAIVAGNTYRLSFNSNLTTENLSAGMLKVYQGGQLIYVSTREINVSETITVTESFAKAIV